MAQLSLDINRALALLEQEARESVTETGFNPVPAHTSFLSHPANAVSALSPELSLSEAVAGAVPSVAASFAPASRRSLSATIA
ncbi:MAG: hypothetical protein HYY64_14245 [Candidatus Rokubacteria bacterium]|nr:hypothetical protein [Candidatus Rokubacteria bacterium]